MKTDFVTALARLLSDPELRESFRRDPRIAADQLGLDGDDFEAFQELAADELDAQAEVLWKKRFCEVRRLLPVTMRKLGEDAEHLFFKHAAEYWPESHQRHLLDAIEFCAFLDRIRPEAVYRSESNALNFVAGGRPVALHFLQTFYVSGKNRKVLQVLFRLRSCVPRQVFFYFGLA